MKKFLLKFAVFLIPLPVYIGIMLLIDPYNYFGVSDWISDDIKSNTSEILNPQLWKMIEFKNQKCSRIILGDSRANKIRTEHVKELTGSDYYNFSYPGGTLIDMIETFWYADSMIKLKEVYMGINFNLYNDFEKNNHVKQVKTIMNNLFSYSFSKIAFTTAIQNIKKQFFVNELKIGVPDMSFDEFWNYEVNVIGKRFYQKYKHPDGYHTDLIKISDYCKANNIKLVFFIPPNHVEWQQRIADFDLAEENKVFLNEISEMGTLYNLDVANEFTENKKNYFDPMHPVNDSLIIHTLWGKDPDINMRLSPK
jgi:hypothetical protein